MSLKIQTQKKLRSGIEINGVDYSYKTLNDLVPDEMRRYLEIVGRISAHQRQLDAVKDGDLNVDATIEMFECALEIIQLMLPDITADVLESCAQSDISAISQFILDESGAAENPTAAASA